MCGLSEGYPGWAGPCLNAQGMSHGAAYRSFVGLDVAKARHAVAVAEDGRQGEVRYLGEIGADAESVRRLVDADTGDIGAATLTTNDIDDASQIGFPAGSSGRSHRLVHRRWRL